jgi:hypothetical protein
MRTAADCLPAKDTNENILNHGNTYRKKRNSHEDKRNANYSALSENHDMLTPFLASQLSSDS